MSSDSFRGKQEKATAAPPACLILRYKAECAFPFLRTLSVGTCQNASIDNQKDLSQSNEEAHVFWAQNQKNNRTNLKMFKLPNISKYGRSTIIIHNHGSVDNGGNFVSMPARLDICVHWTVKLSWWNCTNHKHADHGCQQCRQFLASALTADSFVNFKLESSNRISPRWAGPY